VGDVITVVPALPTSYAEWVALTKRVRYEAWRRKRLGSSAQKMTREDEAAAIAAFIGERGVRRVEFDGQGGVRIKTVRA